MELSSFNEDLAEALLAAFGDSYGLKSLFKFDLKANLDWEVAQGHMRARVLAALEWAEQEGRLDEMFLAALRRRPNNPELRRFAARLAEQTAAEQETLIQKAEVLKGDDF